MADGSKQTIGGMITEKTIKYTKQNKTMAFLTIEDLVGTVEVVVFPRDYEQNVSVMQETPRCLSAAGSRRRTTGQQADLREDHSFWGNAPPAVDPVPQQGGV